MSREQTVYLADILDRIRRIEDYVSVGRSVFVNSELHQDGVIRSFEVIGEIVKRLDVTLTARYPDVEWSNFAGFRDVLIHQYDKIRLDALWDYVQEDLPPLKAAIQALFSELVSPPSEE
ncbi:MAG: HepT-like ribonuclease domain-containing protein [Aggregatilineales bacterium]